MSTLCDIALALGLALDSCAAAEPVELPPGDPVVWDYIVPAPPPPAPLTPEPRVIERVVVREVVKEVPVPPSAPVEEAPFSPPEEVPPARIDLAAAEQLYRMRRAAGLSGIGPGSPFSSAPGFGHDTATGEQVTVAGALAVPPRYIHPGLAGGEPVDNERILAEDRYITGVLETSLNTQLDGSVIIQTSRDIFGYHGRRILLPKGSRLVCDYTSPKKIGEHRIGLVCDRVLTAGKRAEIFQVAAPVGDVQGRSGITGEVDNRFLESYGSAFILTFISASVRAAVASVDDGSGTDSNDIVVSEAGEEISTRFGEITASVLQRTLNLKPIITVPQGTRVQIRPASDWYIRQTGG